MTENRIGNDGGTGIACPAERDSAGADPTEAQRRLGEHMLLSWYDRDRDLEASRHASECQQDRAVPGCVDSPRIAGPI